MSDYLSTQKKPISVAMTDGEIRDIEIAGLLTTKNRTNFITYSALEAAKKIIQEAKRKEKPRYDAAVKKTDDAIKEREDKKRTKQLLKEALKNKEAE